MNSKTTMHSLRQQNRQALLQQVYFAQPISRLELSQQLGLSPATITNVVAELLDESLLHETGSEESQGGRPRTLLTMNADYGYFIGVDVGETRARIELFNLTLHRLAGIDYSIDADSDMATQLVDYIDAGVTYVLAATEIPRIAVLGVGIGVPGIVQRANELMVYSPTWGWNAVPLQKRLDERLHLPVVVDNGAKVMALAELWFGAGRTVESLAVLLIGIGAGSGIIAEGTLYRGATNSAGEWGHTKIVSDGWKCRCGGHGCVEAYVGAYGIVRRFHELAPDYPLPHELEQIIGAIVQAYESNFPPALQVFDETARYLGIGVANLINLFNPEMIILGGWVGVQLGPLLLPAMQRYAEANSLRQPFDVVQFGMCELGLDAVCQGAATLALEQFLTSGGKPTSIQPIAVAKPRVPVSIDMSSRVK